MRLSNGEDLKIQSGKVDGCNKNEMGIAIEMRTRADVDHSLTSSWARENNPGSLYFVARIGWSKRIIRFGFANPDTR